MPILQTSILSAEQKATIYELWNNEYPAQLGYKNMGELEAYLNQLTQPQHYFIAETNGPCIGWAFTFERENQTWFAIIVQSQFHGQGLGKNLLNELKKSQEVLHGWVVDHPSYTKQNGEPYQSPVHFYIRHGFQLVADIRLEIPQLSAAKIIWKKDHIPLP